MLWVHYHQQWPLFSMLTLADYGLVLMEWNSNNTMASLVIADVSLHGEHFKNAGDIKQ